MFEATRAPQAGAAGGEWLTAEVSSIDADGVHLILAGQSNPTQKGSLRLASAVVAVGDLVLCLRAFGTIIVLDKLV